MAGDSERPLETGWLPDTPIEDTVLRRFLHNQGAVNAIIARARGGRTEERHDVLLADANSPVPLYNQAVLTAPVLRADEPVLDAVDAFFAGGDRPLTLLSPWPTPDLTPRGWSLMGHPAFVVRAPGPVPTERPLGVELQRAETAEDYRLADQIMVDGFGFDEARGAPPGSILPYGTSGSGLDVYLGKYDGRPVAVGEVFVWRGVANLCGGATLAATRRRGVWRALVWARVGIAAHLPAVAFTSDMSRPGFVRMGFLPVTRFTLWWRRA